MPAVISRFSAVIAPARAPVAGYVAAGIAVSLKPLAAVFLLREAGAPYSLIGLVLAAEVFGVAIGMLLQGRLLDRFGTRRVLPPLVVVHVVLLTAFLMIVNQGAPTALVIASTLLWGLTQPVLLPTLRALWGTLFTGEQRETAYAVQAVLTEMVFVLGPLTAAGMTLLVSPTAAIILAAALTIFGVLLFAATTPSRAVTATQAAAARTAGLFAVPGNPHLRVLLVIAGLSGVTAGAIEILLPALAEASGTVERAGIGFGVAALGSIVGGLIYGSRTWRGTVVGRLALLTAILALALAPLIATPLFPVACLVLFVSGLFLAPGEACLYMLIDDAADDATVVEANSWITALFTIGLGAGTALGGWFTEASHLAVAAAIPSAAALLSAVVVVFFVRGGATDTTDAAEPARPLTAT